MSYLSVFVHKEWIIFWCLGALKVFLTPRDRICGALCVFTAFNILLTVTLDGYNMHLATQYYCRIYGASGVFTLLDILLIDQGHRTCHFNKASTPLSCTCYWINNLPNTTHHSPNLSWSHAHILTRQPKSHAILLF